MKNTNLELALLKAKQQKEKAKQLEKEQQKKAKELKEKLKEQQKKKIHQIKTKEQNKEKELQKIVSEEEKGILKKKLYIEKEKELKFIIEQRKRTIKELEEKEKEQQRILKEQQKGTFYKDTYTTEEEEKRIFSINRTKPTEEEEKEPTTEEKEKQKFIKFVLENQQRDIEYYTTEYSNYIDSKGTLKDKYIAHISEEFIFYQMILKGYKPNKDTIEKAKIYYKNRIEKQFRTEEQNNKGTKNYISEYLKKISDKMIIEELQKSIHRIDIQYIIQLLEEKELLKNHYKAIEEPTKEQQNQYKKELKTILDKIGYKRDKIYNNFGYPLYFKGITTYLIDYKELEEEEEKEQRRKAKEEQRKAKEKEEKELLKNYKPTKEEQIQNIISELYKGIKDIIEKEEEKELKTFLGYKQYKVNLKIGTTKKE